MHLLTKHNIAENIQEVTEKFKPKPNQCEHCEKAFASVQSLKSHTLIYKVNVKEPSSMEKNYTFKRGQCNLTINEAIANSEDSEYLDY